MGNYLRNSAINFISQIIVLVIGLGFSIIVARTLGPEGKGIITLIQTFVVMISIFLCLGLDEANPYMIGKELNKLKIHKAIFSNSIYSTISLSLLGIVVLIFLRNPLLNSILRNINPTYYKILLAIVPFAVLTRYLRTILQGHSDFAGYNLIPIIQRVLLVVVLILALGYGLTGVVFSVFLSIALSSLIGFIYILIKYGKGNGIPDMPLLFSSLKYGLKAMPSVFYNFFNKRFDVFIVNLFLTPAAVGYYSISVVLAELLWYIPSSLAPTLIPKVASLGKISGYRVSSMVSRNSLFITVVAGIILALCGRFIIKIFYGSTFYPSLFPFWILVPGVVALGQVKVLCGAFHGIGKPEYSTYITGISGIVTLGLDFLLIPKLGIVGAAVASTISYTTSYLAGLFIFKRLSGIAINQLVV